MLRKRRNVRVAGLALIALVVLAAVGAVAARQIRSPAQIAADTAAPAGSRISVPVEQRALATEVIVRGTVRYGAPQDVTLPVSALKTSTSVISQVPQPGARLGEGDKGLVVSGRPVFVLRGATPMHRDLGPGSEGRDVRQLEQALARAGFGPGSIDGRYDGATASAVAAMYLKRDEAPFGPTDTQADQLRAAAAAAGAARDAMLQTRLALRTAERGATPAERNQARLDGTAAAEPIPAARVAITTAREKAASAVAAIRGAKLQKIEAASTAVREIAVADADVTTKRAAVNDAVDAQAEAQRQLASTAPSTSAARAADLAIVAAQQKVTEAEASGTLVEAAAARAELAKAQSDRDALIQSALNEYERLRAALRSAIETVGVARGALNAADRTAETARSAPLVAAAKAKNDGRLAARQLALAGADGRDARASLAIAQRKLGLAVARVGILRRPPDAALERQIVESAQSQVTRTETDLARLAVRTGVQVPADEILFFSSLPVRVGSLAVKRGSQPTGSVMTVSNSRLAIDSSLSVGDVKLVRRGLRVRIEEQDLGVRIQGAVSRIADKTGTTPSDLAGTAPVDPARTYIEVLPNSAPASLVGTSVKLSIAVESTKGKVLAVPIGALSVAADGSSRVQVDLGGGRTRFVTVIPGLAAQGFVEVTATGKGNLSKEDLVVVGSGASAATKAPTGVGRDPTPSPGSSAGGSAPGAGSGGKTTTPDPSPGGAATTPAPAPAPVTPPSPPTPATPPTDAPARPVTPAPAAPGAQSGP